VLRRILFLVIAALLCLNAGTSYAQKKKKQGKKAPAPEENSQEPDKVLYQRAMADMKRGHEEVARLTLQTLINTYPDSEYLADAKLAIADSYYKEGGTANWAQAVSSYKDFGVFFPFLPKAPYAQLQVGMVYYREMEKPDRDRAHARDAEEAFQEFLQKYPKDPLAPKAEQRLREVQEMLAEGDFRIASFYYARGSYKAAGARLISITNRYPLYSQADRALWMLGVIFEKSERKDIAAVNYQRIIREYPLSGFVDGSKKKLTAMNLPIPQPDPQALARMQQERAANHRGPGMLHKATGILHSGPSVQMAATVGKPTLEPETPSSGVDILKPGAAGGGTTGIVATVTSGSSSGSGAPPPSADTPNPPAADSSGAAPATGSGGEAAPGTSSTADPKTGAATGAAGASGAAENKAQAGSDAKPADANNPDPKSDDKNKESTSKKKKKGLRKIIPW
jgi:outer membrane protein assembly factor BamD